MVISPFRKNKINLEDYDYKEDIQHRLSLSKLNDHEIDVIREILQGSLKTKIVSFAEYLALNEKALRATLEKLLVLNLYQIKNGEIVVDKEMRKYYETELERFEEYFRPDLKYFRQLLNKIPIHLLPIWYSIPKTSDNIFGSIIEKYMQTPKIYQRYLDDLYLEEHALNCILQDLFLAGNYTLATAEIQKKYRLTEEKLEEYLLILEFNLVCMVSYQKSVSGYTRIITPFREWHIFLNHLDDNIPQTITSTAHIKRTHSDDFGFIRDLTKILRRVLNKPLPLQKHDGNYAIAPADVSEELPHISQMDDPEEYLEDILDELIRLRLGEIENERLRGKDIAESWLKKHLQEQAITIYRYGTSKDKMVASCYINKNLRELEKCLRRFSDAGWIYFEDFAKACLAPIGDNDPVRLTKIGRRWKYKLPEYSDEDLKELYRLIFKNLFQAGIVVTGDYNDKPCFAVSAFGRMTLE